MSDAKEPARPRQVTLAAWLIMLGSAVVVLSVFDQISGLRTLDTRQTVEEFLSEPPGSGLGLGVDGVLSVLRTLAMVAAGCATAAAILGYQVLRRSKSARLGLTLLAVPLFFTGMATGGFMSSVVAAAAVMLWFQPARDWFDGITRREPEAVERPARVAEVPVAPVAPVAPPPTEPRAMPGFGAPIAPGQPQPGLPHPYAQQPVPTRRPPALIWACALTWAFSGLAMVGLLMSAAVLAISPDLVFDEVHRQNPDLVDQGISDGQITTATYVFVAIMCVWAVAAIVMAVLAYRGLAWARVALVVSSILSALLFLVAALGTLVMVLPLIASVITVAFLSRQEVRAWFRMRAAAPPPAA